MPSTSFRIIEATRNLREFGVSCIGWRRITDKNWSIRGWIGRQIISMCFLPRTRRFLLSRPDVFQFPASSGVRGLIWMLLGMLQSLINWVGIEKKKRIHLLRTFLGPLLWDWLKEFLHKGSFENEGNLKAWKEFGN